MIKANPLLLILLCIGTLVSCKSQTKSSASANNLTPIASKIELSRFEEAIKDFEEFDSRARYHKELILFTGSSSIRFWAGLNDDMAPFHALNRGFGGSTLPEMNYYFDRIVKKYKPEIIFLYCGENDIAAGYTVGETFHSYLEFIDKCQDALPNTPLVYISMKPSIARWNLWEQYKEANEMIKSHAEKHDWISYVDISETMLAEDGKPDPKIFIADQLHMNLLGYERWREIIKPVLVDLKN